VMRVPRTLNKSRRPKSIPLTAREALLLKEQLLAGTARTTLVFPNARGERWNRHRFREQVWERAVEPVTTRSASTSCGTRRSRSCAAPVTGPSGSLSVSATRTVARSAYAGIAT
jgi:hypothetical protein